jgi:methylated-DNA-[protein]-cysteine S-methyltransferase
MIALHVLEAEGLWCGVALEGKKVFATMFASSERDTFKGLLEELPVNSVFQVAQGRDAVAEEALRAIKSVFDGKDVSLSVEFAMSRLSQYSQRVLKLTSLIPTGYVTTYGSLAEAAGGSPRAVGRVMATNPFAPLIPCHRVVTASMTLGGYGGGLRTKWEILQRENREYENVMEAKIDGRALKLFPVSVVRESESRK